MKVGVFLFFNLTKKRINEYIKIEVLSKIDSPINDSGYIKRKNKINGSIDLELIEYRYVITKNKFMKTINCILNENKELIIIKKEKNEL